MTESGKGGRRKGAGRPSGGELVRRGPKPQAMIEAQKELIDKAQGYVDEVDALLARKDSLTPQERAEVYVGLLVRGLPNKEVCKQLGLHEAMGQYYRRQPWFSDKVKEKLSVLQGNRLAVFGPMVPKAIEVFEKHLEDNSESVATKVFDEVFGKPIAHDTPAAPLSITLVFGRQREVVEGEFRELP